jgi:hypothetical protein
VNGLHLIRDSILESLRVQFKAKVRKVVVVRALEPAYCCPLCGEPEDHGEDENLVMEKFLRDLANNIVQGLGEEELEMALLAMKG